MLLQAAAERAPTGSGIDPGARIGGVLGWLGNEVQGLVDEAARNPGLTTLVVALVLALFIARVLSSTR